MIPTLLIVFLSLVGLITLHELGHFLLAKKFGVRVEEFGLLLPPRLWGKKIGETIYSINLIPIGAFVRLYGEDGDTVLEDSDPASPLSQGNRGNFTGNGKNPRSFGSKPIWQRMLIIAGGVLSFWLVAVILLVFTNMSGSLQAVSDDENAPDAVVQVVAVSDNSPAASAGLQMGDIIKSMRQVSGSDAVASVQTAKQVQDFSAGHQGQEIIMTIQRGKDIFDKTLLLRSNPPAGEGIMGIALARTIQRSYTLWQSIGNGFAQTWYMTLGVFDSWGQIIGRLANGQGMPAGAQLVGPIGILDVMNKQAQLGFNYYLQFVAMIAVYLAVFNILPIPALDGGKLMFLTIEAVRKKPIPEKVEQKLTGFFMILLLGLFAIVTIGDVTRLWPAISKFFMAFLGA